MRFAPAAFPWKIENAQAYLAKNPDLIRAAEKIREQPIDFARHLVNGTQNTKPSRSLVRDSEVVSYLKELDILLRSEKFEEVRSSGRHTNVKANQRSFKYYAAIIAAVYESNKTHFDMSESTDLLHIAKVTIGADKLEFKNGILVSLSGFPLNRNGRKH